MGKKILKSPVTTDVTPTLPMVTFASEVRRLKEATSNKYNNMGVTVKKPAASFAIDEIAEPASFVEIELNDLTQYTMAWDRDIPNVNRLPVNQIHASVAPLIENVAHSCRGRSVHYALGLDLRPSRSLAMRLHQIGVNRISRSPNLIQPWIKSFH